MTTLSKSMFDTILWWLHWLSWCIKLPFFNDYISRASDLPVLVPPVMIQAPVVFAAFRRPFRNTRLSLGWRSKLRIPPWTVMRSLGSSSPQCLVNSWRTFSAFVSKLLSLTYWNTNRTMYDGLSLQSDLYLKFFVAH